MVPAVAATTWRGFRGGGRGGVSEGSRGGRGWPQTTQQLMLTTIYNVTSIADVTMTSCLWHHHFLWWCHQVYWFLCYGLFIVKALCGIYNLQYHKMLTSTHFCADAVLARICTIVMMSQWHHLNDVITCCGDVYSLQEIEYYNITVSKTTDRPCDKTLLLDMLVIFDH